MNKLWIIAMLALVGCGAEFVGVDDDEDVEVIILETGVVEYPDQDVCEPPPVEHRSTPDDRRH